MRLRYNLSQKELALIAGVTHKAVSAWECNRTEPRMSAIQKIANHFGLKKSDIIENIDESEETEFIDGFRALNEEGKRLVMEMIRQLNFKRSASTPKETSRNEQKT